MGNVCGCVRAEKEEYYIDPAKAPFTPAKNSSGRKFLKRRKSEKRKETENCDEAEATEAAAEKREDGYNPEDFLVSVSCAYSKSPIDGQKSPQRGSSIGSSVKDSPVPCHHELYNLNSKPSAQREVIFPENVAAYRQLSFPNIPNKLTFLPYADGCYKRKASSLSSIDRVTALGKSHLNSFSEERCYSDVKWVKKARSSDCVVYARYFSAADIARPSYTTSLPHEQVSSPPSPVCQISDIHVTGESEDMSAKEKLLLWTQQAAEGYGGIRCENFTTCWRDGRLFNAIIHRYSFRTKFCPRTVRPVPRASKMSAAHIALVVLGLSMHYTSL